MIASRQDYREGMATPLQCRKHRTATLGYGTLALYKSLLGGMQDPRPKKVGHRDTGPSQCIKGSLGERGPTPKKGRSSGYRTLAVSKLPWGGAGPTPQKVGHQDTGPSQCLKAIIGGIQDPRPKRLNTGILDPRDVYWLKWKNTRPAPHKATGTEPKNRIGRDGTQTRCCPSRRKWTRTQNRKGQSDQKGMALGTQFQTAIEVTRF